MTTRKWEDEPMLQRFERRVSFILKAKPREKPYVDRDGEWGIDEMAREGLMLITALENQVAAMRRRCMEIADDENMASGIRNFCRTTAEGAF